MDRRQFLVAGSATALAAGTGPVLARAADVAPGAADARMRDIADRIFWGDGQLDPTLLTQLGLDTGEHASARSKLPQVGPAAEKLDADHAKRMLAEANRVDRSALSDVWQVRRDVIVDMLEQRLLAEPFGIQDVGVPYRITQQDGVYFAYPDFLDSTHPVETKDDAEAYLARLAALPRLLDQETEAQVADAGRGYLAPGWSLDLAMGQMRTLLEPGATESGMVKSLVRRAEEKGIAGDWQDRAEKIVSGEVFPALERQLAAVGRLRPTTRVGDGIWRVPRGDEIYAKALRYFTTTELTPDEIHKVGLEQVAELTGELDAVLRAAGLTSGSVGERLNELNVRPEQLYPNTDKGRADLIASLNEGVAAMQAKLPRAFATIPTQPLEIRRVPPEIQDGAANGYYNNATLDGSRPAIYWINLKDTGDWPKYGLPALTYHEATPGHHLHLSLLQQDEDLPLLLKNYWLSAYGEGWALYAEQVADELGGYHGVEKAGALQSWLFRAARLVVDTGLHSKRWTREQATDYFTQNTGFAKARSQREVERYCAMPGQACSYKIGQNVWRGVRSRAERELGPKFDLRQFHEVLKQGVMPLALLEKRVDVWIAGQKG